MVLQRKSPHTKLARAPMAQMEWHNASSMNSIHLQALLPFTTEDAGEYLKLKGTKPHCQRHLITRHSEKCKQTNTTERTQLQKQKRTTGQGKTKSEKCDAKNKNFGNAQPIEVTKTSQTLTHPGSHPVICWSFDFCKNTYWIWCRPLRD